MQGLDLGRQVFSDFLNEFVARKEVKNLIDISAKDVNAPKFLNQPGFETGPVGDVVEGSSLVQWDGLEGEDKFDRDVASSQGESVQDGGQPDIEVIGLSTPLQLSVTSLGGLKLADGGGVGWE